MISYYFFYRTVCTVVLPVSYISYCTRYGILYPGTIICDITVCMCIICITVPYTVPGITVPGIATIYYPGTVHG